MTWPIDDRWSVVSHRFPTRVTVEVKLVLGTTLRNMHTNLLKVRSSSIQVKVEVSQETQYKNSELESSRTSTRFFNIRERWRNKALSEAIRFVSIISVYIVSYYMNVLVQVRQIKTIRNCFTFDNASYGSIFCNSLCEKQKARSSDVHNVFENKISLFWKEPLNSK